MVYTTHKHVVELWLICLTFFKKSHKASLGDKFQLLSQPFYFVESRILTSKEKWQSPFRLAWWILADATCRFHQNLLGLSGYPKERVGKPPHDRWGWSVFWGCWLNSLFGVRFGCQTKSTQPSWWPLLHPVCPWTGMFFACGCRWHVFLVYPKRCNAMH